MAVARNNFDLLRLALAGCVLLVHAHVLSGASELAFLSRFLNSTSAVCAFFVVSGYLITMSFERSRSLRQFAVRRARRLVPAYLAAVLAAAAAGLFLSSLPVREYLTSPQLYGYLLANLSLLNFLCPSLPGVFEHSPFDSAVNGALWSIRSEVACYSLVPLAWVLVSRRGRLAGCLAAAAFFAGTGALLLWAEERADTPAVRLLRVTVGDCGLCFALGMTGYYYRDRLRGPWFRAVGAGCLAALAVGIEADPWVRLFLMPAVLAGAVLFVAFGLPYLGNVGRYGDVSYGVYIYHFPIIQCLVSAGLFSGTPFLGLTLAVAVTVGLAAASWFLVERPWLSPDSHYIRAFDAGRLRHDPLPRGKAEAG